MMLEQKQYFSDPPRPWPSVTAQDPPVCVMPTDKTVIGTQQSMWPEIQLPRLLCLSSSSRAMWPCRKRRSRCCIKVWNETEQTIFSTGSRWALVQSVMHRCLKLRCQQLHTWHHCKDGTINDEPELLHSLAEELGIVGKLLDALSSYQHMHVTFIKTITCSLSRIPISVPSRPMMIFIDVSTCWATENRLQ